MNTKKMGRPSLPVSEKRVLFAKRLRPSEIAVVTAALSGCTGVVKETPFMPLDPRVLTESGKSQITALLEDIDRLTKEKEVLQKKFDELMEAGASDSVAVNYWHTRAMVAEKRAAELENQLSGNVG